MSTPENRSAQPVMVKVINSIGRIGGSLGIHPFKLDEQALLNKGRKKTGLNDYGDNGFREGLRTLLESLIGDAKLSPIGRLLAYNQVLKLLTHRLEMIDYWKQHPEVSEEQVNMPLFVLGLPRTGTTILFNLLSQDPACRAPLSWELALPCPPPEKASYKSDPRIAKTEKQLAFLPKLIPGFNAIHPVGAELPQECISITAYDFHSIQFDLSFDLTTYQKWYHRQDLRPTYQFHKKILKHLQSRYPCDYWVLKSPAHLSSIDALLAVYPDARIVQTHRDPVSVMPSTDSLYYALRKLNSDDIDPHKLGMQQAEGWSQSLQRGMEQRDKLKEHANQFYDVQFNDLMADTFGTIQKIYAHFNMNLTKEAELAMKDFLKANQREKHGHHSYSLAMFGLDTKLDKLNEKFYAYKNRFNIPNGCDLNLMWRFSP